MNKLVPRPRAALGVIALAVGAACSCPPPDSPRPPTSVQWTASFVGEHGPTAVVVEVAPDYFRAAGPKAGLRIDYRLPDSSQWQTDHVLVDAAEPFGFITLTPPVMAAPSPKQDFEAILEQIQADWDRARTPWFAEVAVRLLPVRLAEAEHGYILLRDGGGLVLEQEQAQDFPIKFADWTRALPAAEPPCNKGETPRACFDRITQAFIRRFCDAVAARADLARFRPYCAKMREVLTGERRLELEGGPGCNSPVPGRVGLTTGGTITFSGDCFLQHSCPAEPLLHEFIHLVDHDARLTELKRVLDDKAAEMQRAAEAIDAAAPADAAAAAAAAATAARAWARAHVDQAVYKALLESQAYAATLGMKEFIDGNAAQKAQWFKSNMIGLFSHLKENLTDLKKTVDEIIKTPWDALEAKAQAKGTTLGAQAFTDAERAELRKLGCPSIAHARGAWDAQPLLEQMNVDGKAKADYTAELDGLKAEFGCD